MTEENIGVRYWKVSPGQGASHWEEFRVNNFISIGWYHDKDWRKTKFGDLTTNPDNEKIKMVLREYYPKKDTTDLQIAQWAAIIRLFLEIKPGDKVVVYDKKFHINAMCEVIGEYKFEKDFSFPHTKQVKWVKQFNPPLDIRPIKLETEMGVPRTVIKMNERDWNAIKRHADLPPEDPPEPENKKENNPPDKSGEHRMNNEEKLVNKIHGYIQAQGFNFELDLIKNYYISLKTKPFVILTGISGTGKTKLAEYFADAVVDDNKKQFRLIPVRPDWTDDKYLVGYYNPITQQYMSTDFIEFLINAKLDSENPYFVCLDEMNLARVEYYFSKFLSGLESKDHVINLHDLGNFTLNDENKDEFLDWQKKQETKEISKKEFENNGFVISHNGTLIPSKIEIPKNLYFTGTVNMDETTFQFSPKVLDRANTIEILGPSEQEDFFKRKEDIPDKTGISELFKDGMKNQQNYKLPEELKDKIWKLYEILQKDHTHRYDLHFGYRTVNEIRDYMGNSQELLDQEAAFDLQILQKILPKIKGDESIKDLLKNLKEKIEPYRLSNEKLTIIEQRLKDRMYTSFF